MGRLLARTLFGLLWVGWSYAQDGPLVRFEAINIQLQCVAHVTKIKHIFAIHCFPYSNTQYLHIRQFPESFSRETRGNLETTGQIVMQTKVIGQDQDLSLVVRRNILF